MKEWEIGDPVDDAHGAFMDAQNWGHGSSSDDDTYNNYTPHRRGKSDFDVIEKAREYSIQGDHLKAIQYCEKARGGFKSKLLMVFIASEYEAMGDYTYALNYWNGICEEFFNNYDVFEARADLLYYLGRYDEALTSYKKALTLLENSGEKSKLEFSRLNNSIGNTYDALGKPNTAETYKKRSKQFLDDFVTEKMEIADEYYIQGSYGNARIVYKTVLKQDENNVKARNLLRSCERILCLSIEEQNKLRKKAQEELKQKEERKKKLEERKRREEERIAREKRRKEFEEQQRRRKEECEKNPDCIKKEIQHFKRKVLKDYYLLLHFEHYQEKSDIKFREILEYEELLEKLGVKENYSREDFKVLKKENKRIKYILSHVDFKYRHNGVKLFVKNQKKIDKLEKIYPEKGLFKSLLNEVMGSGSEDIKSLEIEVSAGDKLQKAKSLSLDTSSDKNVNLQEARELLDEAKAELTNFLRNKNSQNYPSLINLNVELEKVEGIVNRKLKRLINENKNRLFLINRDRYSNNQFVGKPGMDLKLVKEDNEDIITVYYKNNPVGVVSDNFGSDFEKLFSHTVKQLKQFIKTPDIKYFLKYGQFDIVEIDEKSLKKEKTKLMSDQRKILNEYPKEELITIIDLNHAGIEFKKGTKFKLIKKSDNKQAADAIGVYLDDTKIGFVANSYQACGLTSKARDIKNISDECYVEYLLEYDDKYHIAWIINKLKPVNDYISKKEYDKAIIYIDHLLISEPSNIDYWTTKCSCYEKLKQYDDVNNCYDKLIELDSENINYWESKASNLNQMKKFDEAIECLEKAISIFPNSLAIKSLMEETSQLKEKEELRIEQEKILYTYPKDELITVVRTDNNSGIEKEATLKLIKESENMSYMEYSTDTIIIAAYLDGDKIGYVSNSDDTVCNLTSKVSDINIPDITYAEYIMNYYDSYHIARIITNEKIIKLLLASDYLKNEEYNKVLDCYNDLLKLDPNDEDSLNGKASILAHIRRWDDAIKCYDDLIELNPNYLEAWLGKASVLVDMEKYDEALIYFDKALELEPDNIRTLKEKGKLLNDLERFDEAITCFDKALAVNPDEKSILSLRTYTLSSLRKEAEKKKLYNKIRVLINDNRFEDANKHLDKALKLDSNCYHFLYLKGKVLTELKEFEESIGYLDKAFELNPRCTLALCTKGFALCHLKQFDKAKACLDEAILLNPKDSYALKLMGNLHLTGLKDYPKAIEFYKKATKLDSKDSMLWNNLAEAYLNTKKFEKGLKCCEKALALDCNNFWALFTSGKIYYELEQYDDAMEYATKAEKLNHSNSELLDFIEKIKEGQSAARIDSIHKILRY